MKCKSSLVISILSGCISTQLWADSIHLDVVEVISTATRTEQPISGVAASIIVINADDIKATGAQTLKDIFNNTPGLIIQYGTFPASSSASKSSVSIRGVGATGSLWLLDGRRLSGEVKNPYDMDRIPASMIERIEIVKGPMSALYGADAVGGVINIITKKPKQGLQADVSARYGQNADGDAGQAQLNAHVRGGSDKVRFNLYVSNAATDPYTETEQTETKVGGGRHVPSQVPPVPGFLNPAGPTGGNPFYLQADGSVKPMPLVPANLAGDQIASQAAFDSFRAGVQARVKDSYDVPVSYREESDVTTIGGRVEFDLTDRLTAGVDFNWFEEEREGSYRATFHPMGFMPPVGHKTNPVVGHNTDGTPISFFQQFGKLLGKIPAFDVPVNSRDDNNRLDVSVDVSVEVNDELLIEASLYNSDYEKRNTTTMLEFADFGYPNEDKSAASGMSANVDITALETHASWSLNDQHLVTAGFEIRDEKREATVFSQGPGFDSRSVDYKALFAQDEWDITESLHFILGGRYDEYHQDSYVDASGSQREGQTDSKSTFRFGLVKNLSDTMNLRFNLAQGYRVPDIRELFIQKQTPAGLQLGAQTVDPAFGKIAYELKPETVNSAEIGLTGHSEKLTYEIVVFQNDIDDRIQQVSVDANSDGQDDYFTFENVSSANTRGVETRLGYRFNDRLNTSFSWAELRTENEDSGKDLEFNPERAVSARVDWKAGKSLNIGAGFVHTGEQFFQSGGKDMKTDAYTLVNLNASVALDKQQTWELFGGIDNILDEEVDKRIGSNPGTFLFAGIRGSF